MTSIEEVELLRLAIALQGVLGKEPMQSPAERGFATVPLVLEDTDLRVDIGGRQIASTAYALRLHPDSPPGTRLQILDAGGTNRPLAPGDEIEGKFQGCRVRLDVGSTYTGTAFLQLALNPQARLVPWPVLRPRAQGVALLGSIGPAQGDAAFVTVAENTDPVGWVPDGSFNVNGWKRILLLIYTTSAAGNATSFDLIPWFQPLPGTWPMDADGRPIDASASITPWCEQGTERVSVPDTDTTGGVYRALVWNLSGAPGNMYFSIRNLLAAARTGLGFIVLGIE